MHMLPGRGGWHAACICSQVEAGGLRVNAIVAWLLRNSYTKTLTRTLMLTRAMEMYKKAAFDETCELWQAGAGVERINAIESCATVMARFEEALQAADK